MSADKQCEGCYVFKRCFIEPRLQDEICPCTICIVKTMCKQVCKPQIDYSRLYLRYYRRTEDKVKIDPMDPMELMGDISGTTRNKIIAGEMLLKRIEQMGTKVDLLTYQRYYLSTLEKKVNSKRRYRGINKRKI